MDRGPPGASVEAGCRYCGCNIGKAPGGLEGAQAPACVLCGLAQNLVRPRIDEEACLVWVPEMSQAALNVMIRRCHVALRAHGERVETEAKPARASGIVPTLYHIEQALLGRRGEAETRLGTTSPSALADALLRLRPESYVEREELLSGTRLLSLGRFFGGTTDIYPEIVDSWSPGVRNAGASAAKGGH